VGEAEQPSASFGVRGVGEPGATDIRITGRRIEDVKTLEGELNRIC
jgi:hypothetical protein